MSCSASDERKFQSEEAEIWEGGVLLACFYAEASWACEGLVKEEA
eukprot:CAMPEP_0182514160 /NCGR_PEP_ID=MMETSP1321-20130603/35237_1 /TAXON_ID=91990 /ORGANISM="Bolidomonas sp., Strain RCC1657" /LENGTH=44 /DNA_ID= /DNA_START= /DNA_END= /DNA_ORIENTATION=